MNNTLQKIIVYTIIFCIMLVSSCNLMGSNIFSGIFYPSIDFSFDVNGDPPPYSNTERLLTGDLYPQVFNVYITRSGNSFKYDFDARIFLNKPAENVVIRKIRYIYEGKEGVILKDKKLLIDKYDSKDGWYISKSVSQLCRINLEKIFNNKKPGDIFNFTLIIDFSFDNDTIQTERIEYTVTTLENKYFHPNIFSR